MTTLASRFNTKADLMELWKECLTQGRYADPTDAVVAELAEYFKMPADEVRRRCINWEDDSLAEWEAADRSTAEGLLDFYRTQVSWIFDTMWYHANQYHGTATPESVEIAWGMRERLRGGKHLDFGAGPGSTSLFFNELGWDVSLADVSTTMQDFAKWRLQKHGITATYFDTSQEELPAETYDLITACDVMVHVPDIEETLARLHRALKPGGWLLFNIDNLPRTPKTQWHLYEEQYPILGKVRKIGFRRYRKIIYFHVYQKIERSPLNTRLITQFDRVRYNRYVTMVGNPTRATLRYVRGKLKTLKAR